MVRVISFEQAIAQGETPASIQLLVDWHRDAVASLERSKKLSAKAQRSVDRHRSMITALLELAHRLAAADAGPAS